MAKIDFTRERTYGKSFDGVLKIQGHVSSEENLPLSAESGDIYSVGEDSTLYIFNSGWRKLSGNESDDRPQLTIHSRQSDIQDGSVLSDMADYCEVVLTDVLDRSLPGRTLDGPSDGSTVYVESIGGYCVKNVDEVGDVVSVSFGYDNYWDVIPDIESMRYLSEICSDIKHIPEMCVRIPFTSNVEPCGIIAELIYGDDTPIGFGISFGVLSSYLSVQCYYYAAIDTLRHAYRLNVDFEDNSRWGIVRSVNKTDYTIDNPDTSVVVVSDELMNGFIGKRVYYGIKVISE